MKKKLWLSPKYWTKHIKSAVDDALKVAYFNCEEGSYAWTLASEVVHLRTQLTAQAKALEDKEVVIAIYREAGKKLAKDLFPTSPRQEEYDVKEVLDAVDEFQKALEIAQDTDVVGRIEKRAREEGYCRGIETAIQDLQEAASIEGGTEYVPKLNALADFSIRLWEKLQEHKAARQSADKGGK